MLRRLKKLYLKMRINYSYNQINKAGLNLTKYDIQNEILKEDINTISYWRDAHSFALEKLLKLSNKRGQQISNGSITIVGRLKKLESIKLKLSIHKNMKLSTMQDIGGCRIILSDLKKTFAFYKRIEKFHTEFTYLKKDDYIETPKKTGYRGIHLIFQYKDRSNSNYKILLELQCRTELQHSWATAVETVGFFTKKALKSGQGEKYWEDFFLLVSKLFEYSEMNCLKNDKRDIKEIIKELKTFDKEHDCLKKIKGYKTSIPIMKDHKDVGYHLLTLDLSNSTLKIEGFEKEYLETAQEKYVKIEAENNPNINIVLVSAESVEELEKGYQNYFGNIKTFIEEYIKLIRKNQ